MSEPIQACCVHCYGPLGWNERTDVFQCDSCGTYDSAAEMLRYADRVIREMHRYIEGVRKRGNANRV